MPKIVSTLPLIALISIGGMGIAQDTPTSEAASTVETMVDSVTDAATNAAKDVAQDAADAVTTATEGATEAAETMATDAVKTEAAEAGAKVDEAMDATAETAETMEKPAAADDGQAADTAETEQAAETADKTEAATDAPADQPAAANDQNADTAAAEEIDPTYIKGTEGDWQIKCFRTDDQSDPCQLFQLLKEEAGNPISEFSLFRLSNPGQAIAGATIVVPLGTLLSEELKISVDGGKAKSYAYSFCNLVGCYARIGLTEADINAFKRGNGATITIVPAQAPDNTVTIKASLSGFTAAYDSLEVIKN